MRRKYIIVNTTTVKYFEINIYTQIDSESQSWSINVATTTKTLIVIIIGIIILYKSDNGDDNDDGLFVPACVFDWQTAKIR